MRKEIIPIITEWQTISELKQINEDISSFGYFKEYIEVHRLKDQKQYHCFNAITGQVDFFEPLEVKEEDGIIYYRENDSHVHMDEPESFETQFGSFINHNNGEFRSWLGRDDYYIEGNFCDMFDCGQFVFAVSNLMHMGSGYFKIVRIDSNLSYSVVYDNSSFGGWRWTCLEYMGRFKNEVGYVIIASGFTEMECGKDEKRDFQKRTLLFQIGSDGSCSISKEWQTGISSSNSMVISDGFVYFGQNKMITRLNLSTGEMVYFTNKSDEELKALRPMW